MLDGEEMGGVVRETRDLMETYAKNDVVTITEPTTGAKALAVVTAGGSLVPVPATMFADYRERPMFLRGTAKMLSIVSLIDHINRFKDADSVVFADDTRANPSLTAVYDYHESKDGDGERVVARHMRHHARFAFPLSDEWVEWNEANKSAMSMVEFAIFLEDRITDVVTLDDSKRLSEAAQQFTKGAIIATPQKLMELSLGLKVYEKSAIEESTNLSSGEGAIRFNVEHTDGNGKPIKVPSIFVISIPVFKNGPSYLIVARLRYRTNGGLKFWFELWRPDRSFDDAFNEAVEKVKAETGLPVLTGFPEA